VTKSDLIKKLLVERERLMKIADACDEEHLSGVPHANPYVNRSLVAASVLEDVMALVAQLENVK
jgi:hypothetical protein